MRPSANGGRELADDNLGFGRLEECTRMAQKVVSSASSVIGETTQPMGPGVHEVLPVGSDCGGISNNTRARIERWIFAPGIPEDVTEEPMPPSEGPGNLHNLDQDVEVELFWVFFRKAEEMYRSKDHAKAEGFYHKVLEGSEKLQIEIDRNDIVMKLGATLFEQQKWDKAQSVFSEVTGGSHRLAELFIEDGDRKSAMYDIGEAGACFERALAMSIDLPSQVRREVHAKAGMCYFKLGKTTEAEKHFLAAAKVESGELDLRSFEAEHYLAMIHFQKSELDIAKKHCLVASNGRKRSLGKSHASWHESIALSLYESIALLTTIYEETGDPIVVAGYLELLPKGYRRVCALVTQG